MDEARLEGSEGQVFYRVWKPEEQPRCIAVIVHGYAEHGGRYAHVADALAAAGALVCAPDHIGPRQV